jgi:hypothetical protein
MDFLKKAVSDASSNLNQSEGQQPPTGEGQTNQQSGGAGSFLDGIKDKVNSAAGGGADGEKNEDMLDKYVIT